MCSDDGVGEQKSRISIKWFLAFHSSIGMDEVRSCPLSARRLWLIKGDQQSMSWLVFWSLLWKFPSRMPHFNCACCLLHSWPLGDWQWYNTLLRNVTSTRLLSSFRQHRMSLSYVLPIVLFSLWIINSKHRFNPGLWFLLEVAFTSTFPSASPFSFSWTVKFGGFLTG